MEYKISKIDDLFKVPADRRRACLDEMATGYERIESVVAQVRAKLPRWLHWLVKPRLKAFVWIDDGKHNETVKINGRTIYERENA